MPDTGSELAGSGTTADLRIRLHHLHFRRRRPGIRRLRGRGCRTDARDDRRAAPVLARGIDCSSLELVDLNDAFEAAFDDLRVAIEERDAAITAEPLPTVYGDEVQLRRVFRTLLDNGIEYDGGDSPQVHVSAERTGERWTINVADGVGIDPESADKIFDIFRRLHTRDEHSGTGIGLAISERLVEHHDGEIWVDSDPEAGSTFSFTPPTATDCAT